MAEFTGHYSGADPKHVARITRITHRRSPIFQTMNGGGYEHVSVGNMITREPLLDRFVKHISPRVKAVHLPPYSGGFTALMTASFANNRELAELLLAYNANFGVRNDEGKTAAEVAAGLGNMELAARLRLEERHVDFGYRRSSPDR